MLMVPDTHGIVQVSPMWDSSYGGDDVRILSDVCMFTVPPPIGPLLDGGILTPGARLV